MEIYWTLKAQKDLERIYQFSLQFSRQHANDVLDRLISASDGLMVFPAMGTPQVRYEPREVRKVVFDVYEIHYEIKGDAIFFVDLWHTKEDR